MRNYLICLCFLLVGAACPLGDTAVAQQWPTHPLRMIVPWPSGNGADILMRLIAERLSPALGQQVIVDNRAGAGGIVGTAIAAKSAPDGYTYFVGGSGIWQLHLICITAWVTTLYVISRR